MNSSSPVLRALSAAVMLSLSTGCATRFVPPTPDLPSRPLECVKVCAPIPEPSGPSEAEMLRWEWQLVQWSESCASVARDCAGASK